VSADGDAVSRVATSPGDGNEGEAPPRLREAVEAVADGGWPPAGVDDASAPLIHELEIIARIAQVHRAAAGGQTDAEGGPSPSASLGEVLSRSIVPMTTRPDLTGARRWGPLFVLEWVGGGSFGEVYRAWDPALDREVALKLLRVPSTSPDRASVFVREGQLLASVRHPNVIDVHGAAQIDGEVGIWMEFVRGRTLEQIVLEDGPMSAQEASVIAESLCGALAAVHQQGLLHRDIKAANVMRATGGRIVLLDFGTGTEAASDTGDSRRIAGTPLYMAPEVLSGKPATVRSDVYSLGVLMFFLVSGAFPVFGKTLSEVRDIHRSGESVSLIDVRHDLPLAFVRVVDRALVADPSRRAASAGALVEALIIGGARPDTRWTRSLTTVTVVAVAMLFGMTLVGAVTSRYFNVVLGRAPVSTEGLRDWFSWGFVASVAPVVLLLFALLGTAVLTAIRRLLVRSWPPAARWDARRSAWVRRQRLNEPTTLGAFALFVSLSALVAAAWYFSPLLAGLFRLSPNLSETAHENLAVLAKGDTAYRQHYRGTFTWVTIIAVFSWYPVLRAAWRRQEPVNHWLLAGGGAVIVLAVLLLQFPYRLFVHSEFEGVTWKGYACFVLGQRGDDLLLFCPDAAVPRNRMVSRTDPALTRGGITNLFYDLENHP
jgi:hypothetical protein